MVLASASTGASFTLPLLEGLIRRQRGTSVRQVRVLLVAREWRHVEVYVRRILQLRKGEGDQGPVLEVEVAITGQTERQTQEGLEEVFLGDNDEEEEGEEEQERLMGGNAEKEACIADMHGEELQSILEEETEEDCTPAASPSTESPSVSNRDQHDRSTTCASSEGRRSEDSVWDALLEEEEKIALEEDYAATPFEIHRTAGRPNLQAYLQRAIDSSAGRVGIIACGGKEFTMAIRKAHHRVRGSEEIWLHAEEFGS